jgi:hypothetical protein
VAARFRDASDLLRWCSGCADVREFEVPDCAEGHGGDCPELICTGCGEALLVAFPQSPVIRSSVA